MAKSDTLVIGGGLFGHVIAKQLKAQGRNVVIWDDGRPMNGTAPSGMLMKPSWFGSMGKDVHEPAIKTLASLYNLQELRFRVGWDKKGLARTHPVLYIDAEELLTGTRTMSHTATKVVEDDKHNRVLVHRAKGTPVPFELVVMACGVWANEILMASDLSPVIGLVGKQGISFVWDVGAKDFDNFVEPWAPYKQTVGFKRNAHEVWVGDGTALLPGNWPEDRAEKCIRRCAKTAKLPMSRATAIMGIRPYVKGAKPCYVERLSKRLFVATGGAKNGGIAAGWVAQEIGRQV